MTNIQVNQVGYMPNDYKTATFRIEDTNSLEDEINLTGKLGGGFRVIDVINNEVVYEGKLSKEYKSEHIGEVNKIANFSEVTKPGKYAVESDISGRSYTFEINENVYDEIFKSSMKMFYLQRCGQELDKQYADKYAHPACHNTKARIYGTDEFIDVSGAWHDAGDYGRYIVAAAKAVVDLMMAYEYYPEVMETSFDIPESGNGIPDILDEVKYELDWMLKMQDPASGGVYHKVTCRTFPGFVMPEEEKEELVVCPISDTATCDFAASMAYAYRIYSNLSDRYGDKALEYEKAAQGYLKAAKKAMAYLENNSAGEFINPSDVVTGEYGDERTIDEFFWAYAEMYKTTGEKKYEDKLKALNLDDVPGEFGWKEVGDYGFYAYLTSPFETDEDLYKKMYSRFSDEAKEKFEKFEKDPYRGTLFDYYYWGCNMEIANNAMRGIILDKIDKTDRYEKMAQAQLHYILGNNPNGKCFVTGFGTDSPLNPHHRPSKAVNSSMPGMLVGGPEPLLLDDVAKKNLKGKAPAKCYLDHLDSYSTNEITIYWNSPLVFLLAHMMNS